MNRRGMLVFVLLMIAAPAWSDDFCAGFRNDQPQSTPEATYRLELAMMKEGVYCHDLAIFDPAWQKRSAQNSRNDSFRQTAQFFDIPFKTREEGSHAVIYYPESKTLGPVFLYRDQKGWVLDRTAAYQYIHYGDAWMAYDGEYPYLNILKKVFYLQEGQTAGGHKAYSIKHDPAPE